MTTIASDGRTVAADGLESWGSEAVRRDRVKVRLGPGRVFAMSGTAAFFEPCIAWYMGGAKPDAAPEAKGDNTWGFCVFERDKVVYYSDTAPYPMEYPYPFTLGSGCDYAMGAMLHGATPREAVAIAASRNLNTGGVITEVEIPVVLSEAAE